MMSYLTRLLTRFSIFAAVAMSTVGCVTEDFPDTPADTTARLRIRVGTANTGVAGRAGGLDIDPSAESYELMHTLRIVIVRADGTVEHNRRIDFNNPNGTNISGYENFIVEGNEAKTVYTFANEESLPGNPDTDPNSLEYTIRSLQIGQPMPKGFDKLELSWGETSGAADGTQTPWITVDKDAPVFMSRRIEIAASELATDLDNADHAMITVSKNIVIIRAAVKLTYTVKNESAAPISLNQIIFNGLTGIEYFLPTDVKIYPSEDAPSEGADNRFISRYSTPSGLDKGEASLLAAPETIDAGGEAKYIYYVNEAPVWNAQGSYSSQDMPFEVPDVQTGTSPYSTSLLINELEFNGAFDNLPALPRNTHVKIDITVGNANQITCEVKLVPYISVELNPWFGFEEPYPPFTPPTTDD